MTKKERNQNTQALSNLQRIGQIARQYRARWNENGVNFENRDVFQHSLKCAKRYFSIFEKTNKE